MSSAPRDARRTNRPDRSEIMKRFGAPRRGVPRRPGSVGARFIDRPTTLPNRVAFVSEVEFALLNHPHYVAVVLIRVEPGSPSGPVASGEPTTEDDHVERLLAATARLRSAVRPSDLVAHVGVNELGAALWSLDRPDVGDMVFQRVQRVFGGRLTTTPQELDYDIVGALGVAPSGATGNEALAIAWAALEAAQLRRGRTRRSV